MNRPRSWRAAILLCCVPAVLLVVRRLEGPLPSSTGPSPIDSAGHRKLISGPLPSGLLAWTAQTVTASVSLLAVDRDGIHQAPVLLVPLVSWWKSLIVYAYAPRWPHANTTTTTPASFPAPLRPLGPDASAMQRRRGLRTDLLAHLQSLQDPPRPPTTTTALPTHNTNTNTQKHTPTAPPSPPGPESLSPPSSRASPPPNAPQSDSLEAALVEAALALIEDSMGAVASSPNGYRRLHNSTQRRLRGRDRWDVRRHDDDSHHDYSPTTRHFNKQHSPAPPQPVSSPPAPAPAPARDVSVVPDPFAPPPNPTTSAPQDNKQLAGTANPQRVGLLGALRGIMQRRQGQRQGNKQEGEGEEEGEEGDQKKEARRPIMERLEDQWFQRSEQQLMGRQRQNFQAMQAAITGILADSATEDEGI